MGYNGYRHNKGDKVVAICDRNCNVVSSAIFAAGNKNESPLIRKAFKPLGEIARKIGINLNDSTMSLDGAYDCRANRKKIYAMCNFGRGLR